MLPLHSPNRNLRGLVGVVMFIGGSAVLVAYSAVIAWRLQALSGGDALGVLGSLGLTSLHAVRNVALEPALALSVAPHVLILFSAFLATLVGIAFIPRRALGGPAPDAPKLSAPRKGDQ